MTATKYTVTLDLIGHDGRDELERQIKHYLPEATNIQIEDSEQSVLDDLIAEVRALSTYVEYNAVHSWERKYDECFGCHLWNRIRDAGYYFSWYDPDTSYEEDVRAYVTALNEWADRMEREQHDNGN